jgi:sarcosine oxidase
MPRFDVIICGLGAMGSAALEQLARRGARVLGIERFAPGHDRGSSHGASRIIRLGYFEHPSYVPLLRRAYAAWRELEQASGLELLHITGILEMGLPDGTLVRGTLASAHAHSLPHELLAASDLMRRFPQFRLPADYVGVLQGDGGWIAVDPAFEAWISLAKRAGAEMRTGVTVRAVEQHGYAVRVRIDSGAIEADCAIVAAGAWTRSLIPGLAGKLRVTREVMGWFDAPERARGMLDRMPVFMLESRHGMHYGIPPPRGNISAGIKVAKHHHRNQTVDPGDYDRAVSQEDEALIRAALADHAPALNGALVAAKTCLYTLTPDGDFLIDRLPGSPQIMVASACSGHGFKFAPVIGEILADLATVGKTRHATARFGLGRLG